VLQFRDVLGCAKSEARRKAERTTAERSLKAMAMIPRTPGVRYLISKFIGRLRDEDPRNGKLPPRPDNLEAWELRAALSIVLEEMRAEFACLGSRINADAEVRDRLDAYIDGALTRTESVIDEI
jgi:hypothetical protein